MKINLIPVEGGYKVVSPRIHYVLNKEVTKFKHWYVSTHKEYYVYADSWLWGDVISELDRISIIKSKFVLLCELKNMTFDHAIFYSHVRFMYIRYRLGLE